MADAIPNTYGERFESLLPKTVSDIEREIALLTANILNGTVADRQKLSYLLDNESELKRYINDRYGVTYNEATTGMYANSLGDNKSIFGGEGVAFGFRQDQLDVMAQLKRRNVLLYQIETSKAANIIFDSMISWSYTGNASTLAPFEALVGEMGASRYGSTIINTQISKFDRSVSAMAAENAEVERFIYRGPRAERPFCQKVLTASRSALGISGIDPSGDGIVYTLNEINAMRNGQTSDVLTTAGGYNCRHRWVPYQGES